MKLTNYHNSICPFDYRYGSEEMRSLLKRENVLRRFVEVEVALMKALEDVGLAPNDCHKMLRKCAFSIRPGEVDELEAKLGHDLASLAILIAEKCGDCGKYVHLGATSYDIVDTAWALIAKDAVKLAKGRLRKIIKLLMELSIKYRDALMVGRTHGQHALPITLGFKLANYVYELSRSYERFCELEGRAIKGKMSGAVGTMAAWGAKGPKVEEIALSVLGLKPHAITTQVAPRDGYAELLADIAILASQLDRLALEIRELSRNEIRELYIATGRVGSSTMPHKRNPTIAERISGLARVCRALVTVALENIPLLHERDLTNSSSERFLVPHALLAIDQLLIDTHHMLSTLRVNKVAMKKNLELSKGAIMAECLMVKLVLKAGVPRHKAYSMLSDLSGKAQAHDREFREVVANSKVSKLLSNKDIEECFIYTNYLGSYNLLINRSLSYANKVLRES